MSDYKHLWHFDPPKGESPHLNYHRVDFPAVRIRKVDLQNLEDIGFIYGTWLQSLKEHNPNYDLVSWKSYKEQQKNIIGNLLLRPNISNLIMCHETDLNEFIGFIVSERLKSGKFILHYAYTKSMYRNKGIFQELLNESGCDYYKEDIYCTAWTWFNRDVYKRYRMKQMPFETLYYEE